MKWNTHFVEQNPIMIIMALLHQPTLCTDNGIAFKHPQDITEITLIFR